MGEDYEIPKKKFVKGWEIFRKFYIKFEEVCRRFVEF